MLSAGYWKLDTIYWILDKPQTKNYKHPKGTKSQTTNNKHRTAVTTNYKPQTPEGSQTPNILNFLNLKPFEQITPNPKPQTF